MTETPQAGSGPVRWSGARVAALLAALFVLYAFVCGTAPTFFMPNELLPMQQARVILLEHRLSIDDAAFGDTVLPDTVKIGDNIYPNKSPGGTLWLLWAMPVAMRLTGDGMTPALIYFTRVLALTLPFVLFLGFLGRQLERVVSPAAAWGFTLAYAIASNAGIYATLYFTHNPAAMCYATAFFLLWRERPRVFFAGLLAGAGFLFENSTFVFPFALAYLAARKWGARGLAAFGAGVLPSLILQAAYQQICFGSPWRTATGIYHRAEYGRSDYGMGWPRLKSLYGLLIGPSRGVLFHSPWLFPAIAAVPYAVRASPEDRPWIWTVLGAAAAQILWISAYAYWDGGLGVGARYLTAAQPFFVIAAAFGWRSIPEKSKSKARLALFALAGVAAVQYALFFASAPFHPNPGMPASLNYARDLAWPFLAHGFSVFTIANAFGASIPVSQAVLAAIFCGVLFVYLSYLLKTRPGVIVRGLLWTLALSALWFQLGIKDEPLAAAVGSETLNRNHFEDTDVGSKDFWELSP